MGKIFLVLLLIPIFSFAASPELTVAWGPNSKITFEKKAKKYLVKTSLRGQKRPVKKISKKVYRKYLKEMETIVKDSKATRSMAGCAIPITLKVPKKGTRRFCSESLNDDVNSQFFTWIEKINQLR